VQSVAGDEAPKTRRTSRTAARRKAGTQQEEKEKATHGKYSLLRINLPDLFNYLPVNPLPTWIRGDWSGFGAILTCKGFNPPQSSQSPQTEALI
jgi:hypothetical protein